MPRIAANLPNSTAADSTTAADRHSKPLLSHLDEIDAILGALSSKLPAPLLNTPSVTAWIDAFNQQQLQWSTLPAAVDAGSTNMGHSTARSDKKRAKKLMKLDTNKVNARVLRKQQQVESFLAVLQPLVATLSSEWQQQQQHKADGSSPAELAALVAADQTQQHKQQHKQQQQQPVDVLGKMVASQQADNNSIGQEQQQRHTGAGDVQAAATSRSSHHLQQQQQQQQRASSGGCLHILDFGCGSGNLLLPLAALFPGCLFTGVDMKPAALQLLQQRAAAAGLKNVQVFEGMIEHYQAPFHIALALHACGNATDYVLQMAVHRQAAFIVSPCCVGKLKFSMSGGSSFHSSNITWTPRQPGDKPPAAAVVAPPPATVVAAAAIAAAAPPAVAAAARAGASASAEEAAKVDFNSSSGCRHAVQQQVQRPSNGLLHPPDRQQQHQHQQEQQPQQQQVANRQLPPPPPAAAGGEGEGDLLVAKLHHPRSVWLRSLLPEPERHFRIMARVADIAHAPADQALLGEALAQRAAVAHNCKRFVELDRCAAAAEAGYAVGLFKVCGAETMAKNDLLVGIPADAGAAAVSSASVTDLVQRGLLWTAQEMSDTM